jgi:hypothetical protein
MGVEAGAGPLSAVSYNPSSALNLTTGSYAFATSGMGAPEIVSESGATAGQVVATGLNVGNVAVFAFTSVNIATGVSLTASATNPTGPIALLSASSAVINGQINLSAFSLTGGPGSNESAQGVGGAGGWVRDPNAPPGPSGYASGGGGGGGFGGMGGAGGSATPIDPFYSNVPTAAGGAGGGGYFSLADKLQGGFSGGGSSSAGFGQSIGGGGGGAIELGAAGLLSVGGTITAFGGYGYTAGGGGGSGGGIFLHGTSVAISGNLNVQGGAGASASSDSDTVYGAGGGGSGGLILAEYAQSGSYTFTGTANVQGGTGFTNGAAGRFDVAAIVPEPSSLALLATASLILVARIRPGSLRKRPS